MLIQLTDVINRTVTTSTKLTIVGLRGNLLITPGFCAEQQHFLELDSPDCKEYSH